ncbi:hypothetical protein IHE45_03G052100 [Dioscorea alata]|uniref:Uncharacterized protein n=1 Tax=Dioscorea alata TaxID=55571 RepID=A0ACB7WLG1_DIOAL|nr:hypothetical protein IHE45_03G052100 [Dioscorea alata]
MTTLLEYLVLVPRRSSCSCSLRMMKAWPPSSKTSNAMTSTSPLLSHRIKSVKESYRDTTAATTKLTTNKTSIFFIFDSNNEQCQR